jgi:hypothetical protein
VPPGLALARFLATYGGSTLHGWRETRDGMIPFRLFTLLARAIPVVGAQRRLDLAQAVGLGFGGDKGGTIVDREIATAFPEESRG